MSSSTSAADRLAQCVEFLRSLTPEGLDSDETYAPLVETGCALFKSQVLKRAFGQEDVLSYMRDQLEQKRLLKKLEKLAQRINEVHEGRLRKAKFAGINTQRQESWMSIQAGEMPTALMEAPPVGLLGSATGTLAAPPDFSQDAEATKQVLDASSILGATAQPPVGSATATGSGDDTEIDMDAVRRAASLHPGSFSQSCNSCGHGLEERHRFYHQLCVGCAELNWTKRLASPDMRGKVAVVTGGRVRIGFHIVLKLLRAGATVLTTTRYPVDAAARYSREPDFDEWRSRLEVVGPLDLCDLGMVERFCDALAERFDRIDVLVNNAAQTLTRAPGWFDRMDRIEAQAEETLPDTARQLLLTSAASAPGKLLMAPGGELPKAARSSLATQVPQLQAGLESGNVGDGVGELAGSGKGGSGPVLASAADERSRRTLEAASGGGACVTTSRDALAGSVTVSSGVTSVRGSIGELSDTLDTFFPLGKLDESQQPLDLSPINSWARKLGQVGTSEILHTMAANAVAPFVLCARLRGLLAPRDASDSWGHIVNVNALEGKFSVTKKQSCHPHTNMAKAALNMLTCTTAIDLAQSRILINSVDTGWVTDMAPGGVGALAAIHATQVAPPLDEVDGAARVLDPVFMHVQDPRWVYRGKLWKDYKIVRW